jgi:uncharacterized RDD family membrane protein YckC
MESAGTWGHTSAGTPRRVGVAPRAVAAVIDFFVSLLFLGLPLTMVLGERTTHTTVTSDGTQATASTDTYWGMDTSVFLLWVVLTLAYFIVFETYVGATVGKLVLNLRVRQVDGNPISFEAALLRNTLRIVDCFPYFLPYLVGAGFIWSGSERRQRLGDRVADTIVTYS